MLPASVCVVGKQHPATGAASFCAKNTWLHAHPGSSLGVSVETNDGYKIGLQFRDLLLVIAHWPGEVRYLLGTGLHTPLWPTTELYSSYYAGVDITSEMDSRIALEHFSKSLAVIHEVPSGLISIPQLYVRRSR